MKHEHVVSSMIRSIGYDPETRKMEVKFKNGNIYTHENVEPDAHESLVHADSVGKHYNQYFRNK